MLCSSEVVDAFECDDSVLISARYNEVVKYITNNDYMLQISVLVMSEATYKKLPPDLQKIVDQASQETQKNILAKSQELVQALPRRLREEGSKGARKAHGL